MSGSSWFILGQEMDQAMGTGQSQPGIRRGEMSHVYVNEKRPLLEPKERLGQKREKWENLAL
jgi:hypothetical protein